LVLVDTPGVGENEDMDTVIEKFVGENQVMGFVYIIKSDAGGGVDEDRKRVYMNLLRFPEMLIHKFYQNDGTISENGNMFVSSELT
jgi:hypothetical protein